MRDQEVINDVKKTIFEAGMAFLNHHSFPVGTKNGKDFIVWCRSIQNRHTSDIYFSDRATDFLNYAENAGKRRLKALMKESIPDQKNVFNEAVGMALCNYIAFQKANPEEVEMQKMNI